MEQKQSVAQRRERRTAQVGGGLAALGLADYTSNLHVADTVNDYAASTAGLIVPDTAGLTTIGVGLAVAAYAHRRYRTGERAERLRILHAPEGWMTRGDLATHSGRGMARTTAKQTRKSLTRAQRRNRRDETGLAARLGTLISGRPGVRNLGRIDGAPVFSSWEDGLYVTGEPGAWKSAFLANQVMDFPGPAFVTSTKPEFYDSTALYRAHHYGPVWLFHPGRDEDAIPYAQRFRWNLVRGCTDADTAWARADALMDSAGSGGLSNAEFWTSRARNLLAPLLAAADYAQGTLRTVNKWLQSENYKEASAVLTRAVEAGRVEESLRGTLEHMLKSKAQPASGSAAQTATSVLEFLMSSKLARALCPADDEPQFDFNAFVRSRGTLYMATGDSGVLAPITTAIAAELRTAATRFYEAEGRRLDPPMAMIYDEASATVPSVPVHEHAAQVRGLGIWHCVAVQNYAQVKEKWGEFPAHTLRTNLQTHLVLAVNDQDDREYYERRMGTRRVKHVKQGSSAPDTLIARVFGNPTRRGMSVSNGVEYVDEPVFPASAWSTVMRKGWGVVVPARGRPGVVRLTHGLALADRRTAELQSMQQRADVQERAEAERVQPAGRPVEAEGGAA